ncbi:MAG: hypothetical protein KAW91_06150, partial [candidate division Zixibacteria bacterium]|nr:hypothetical protein [candidate division Zixibacteria bacterium]
MTLGAVCQKSARRASLLLVIAVIMLVAPAAQAQMDSILIVKVGDTVAYPGERNSVISIFLSNYNPYEVVGFNIWLQLDRPDLMIFQTDIDSSIDTTRFLCIDTTEFGECIDSLHVTGDTIYWYCNQADGQGNCTDSTMVPADSVDLHDFWYLAEWDFFYIDTNEIQIGNIDVSGTLMEDWDWYDARSLSGQGTDLNIAGLADLPGPGSGTTIAPQVGGLLVRMLADVEDIPDTLEDREVNIMIQYQFLGHFNFSDPDGLSMGIATKEVPDTNYWNCTSWAGSTCLSWTRVPHPPADSMAIEIDTIAYVDTLHVWLDNGSLTVLPALEGICGDVNGDMSEVFDIGDLVFLVDYMFLQGPEPEPLWVAD